MKKIRVNIRSVANIAAIRHEKRNGRDVIVVPSATLPDDIVMNGIKYPADEIEKSFKSLNRTPAPYGHPTINGKLVSARDPEGINVGYIGAWNENVRRENGRVFLDKVIDVEVANRTESGKAVLNAIEKGEPIHTSTGLLCELDAANGDDYKYIARNMFFDHDAILLNEDGAATPDQGVGMLVNSSGEQEEIEVVNSVLSEADRDLDWAVDSAVRAIEKMQKVSLYERIKSAILDAVLASGREPKANQEKLDMADEKKLEELSATVNTLSETVSKINETIANAVTAAVKPLTDNLAEIQANQKAKDDAELTELVGRIVKANVMDEDTAKELTLNAARALAEKAKPGKAAPVAAGAFAVNNDDEWAGYDLNAVVNDAKKEA